MTTKRHKKLEICNLAATTVERHMYLLFLPNSLSRIQTFNIRLPKIVQYLSCDNSKPKIIMFP
jgi:hypothetical protein